MASIRKRVTKRGETTYQVLYRHDATKLQTSTTFVDEKSAVRFKSLVDALKATKALETLEAEAAHGLTVDELAEEFFAWKAGDVEPRTLTDYRRDYDNWIRRPLGSRYADTIDELDVQKWVDSMKKKLDAKSVADRHMILHSMFKFGSAKVRRLVGHNPCTETQLPERTKKPPKGVTIPEWQTLHAAAEKVEPDAADLMLFIVASGWRWSEAAALTVSRVEEYPDKDGVERMFVSMGQVMRGGNVTEGAKSTAGYRRIKLPASAAAMVRRRIVGKGPDDLVFTNAAGRKWYQQNFLNRTWTRIVEASGLKRRPTPHMLRHTHVALLDRAGATMAEMQRRLGHESIQTTINVYGGMIDDLSGEALDKLDALIVDDPAAQIVQGDVVLGHESLQRTVEVYGELTAGD